MRVTGKIAGLEAGRLAVTLFALIAFALQSYVVPTHFHKPSAPGYAGIAAALDLAPPPQDGKAPIKQSRQTCPVCQGIAHAGAFVTPSAAPALLPTLSVQIVAIVLDVGVARIALSHSWQSRGPPAI